MIIIKGSIQSSKYAQCKTMSKSIGLVTPEQRSLREMVNPAHVIHPLLKKLKKKKQTNNSGRRLPTTDITFYCCHKHCKHILHIEMIVILAITTHH